MKSMDHIRLMEVKFCSRQIVFSDALYQCGLLFLQGFLKDKSKVDAFVQMVDPVVRALDGIVGEKVSMRVCK